jgi:menaquinone-dependent protoporphyrinogen oxidase
MNVLVGYASAHGSTAEIARFMADILEERGLKATVSSVAEIESVDAYDAVVVGSAIHGGMWLTEMSQFLAKFADALAKKPVYVFITCIRVLEEGGYQHSIEEYVNHSVLDKIGVRDVAAFAGKLEMNAVDWQERWTLSARYDGSEPPGTYNNDFRNWDTIRAWTVKVVEQLQKG